MDFFEKQYIDKYMNTSGPSPEEAYEIMKSRGDIFITKDLLDTTYFELQQYYRTLFGLYFLSKSNIYKIDEELLKRNYRPASSKDMDFFQKYDLCGSDFLYLNSWIHIERLSQDEKDLLMSSLRNQDDEALFEQTLFMITKTYKKVLMINPDSPDTWFELSPSIYGEKQVQGKSIVFSLRAIRSYNTDGMYEDFDLDYKKELALSNIIKQLETILSDVFSTPIIIFQEN